MIVREYNVNLTDKRHPELVVKEDFLYNGDTVTSPGDVCELLNDLENLYQRAEEYVFLMCLTARGEVLGIFEVSHGNVSSSLVGMREIFMRALLCGACSIIVAHNHPSGDMTPSEEDKGVYEKLKECSRLMDIPVLDFLIIGNGYYSFSLQQ